MGGDCPENPDSHTRKPPSEKEEDDDDDNDDYSDSGSMDLYYDDGDDVRTNKSKRGNEAKRVSAGENSKKKSCAVLDDIDASLDDDEDMGYG